MPAPTIISGFEIQPGTSATPGAQSITVPSDAEGVLVFTRRDGGGTLNSLTSSFAGTFTNNLSSYDGEPTSVSMAAVNSTGSQTLTLTWTNSVSEGPVVLVAFVKDVDTSSYANWIRDVAFGWNWFDPSPASATVDSTTDDGVIALDSTYTFGEPPPTATGWTSLVANDFGFNNNAEAGRLSTANSPGASTTTFTSQAPEITGIVVVSIIGASSGGVTVDLSATDAADTLSAEADLIVGASLSATDAADTLSAASTMPVTASLTATDATDTLSAAAGVLVLADLSETDDADTLDSEATVGAAGVTVDFSQTDADDEVSADALVVVGLSLSQTDDADTLSGAALLTVGVALDSTDAADTLSAASTMPVTVDASVSDAADTLSATAGPVVGLALSETDETDVLDSEAIVSQAGEVGVTFDQTDASDVLEADATVAQEDRRGSGGRNWARFLDVPLWRVQVQASITDDDDSLVASASVPQIAVPAVPAVRSVAPKPQWPVLAVGAELTDEDDTGRSVATAFWPKPGLVRSNAKPSGLRLTRS